MGTGAEWIIPSLIFAGGSVAAAELSKPDEPDIPAPPEVDNETDLRRDAQIRAADVRRAGRPSTLLTDDYDQPVSETVNPGNVGRATLLGG